jgi:hypothetical protein
VSRFVIIYLNIYIKNLKAKTTNVLERREYGPVWNCSIFAVLKQYYGI